MDSAEFEAFQVYFVADYSKEIAANYGHALSTAIDMATHALVEDLPGNETTPGHELQCILREGDGTSEHIGYLWYAIQEKGLVAFIHDFVIFGEYRSQGFGTETIEVLEKHLALNQVSQIKLRVAFDNKRALQLYEKCGFSITGYNMIKRL